VRQAKIELPFPIDGRGSIHVKISIPVNDARDPTAYRLKGTATLPRFRMAGLEMLDVEARVSYADGVVRLDELRGRVPSDRGEAGTFKGKARLDLIPRGDFTASLDLGHIPLARVMTLLPNAAEYAGGSVSGSVEVRARSDRFEDVTAWHATGKLRSDQARVYGLTLADVAADFRLEKGLAQMTSLVAKIEGATLTGSAEVGLTGENRYRMEVRLRNADLARLQRLAPQFRPPVPVAGRLETSARASGTLRPLTVTGGGTATAEELRISDIRARSFHVEWEGDTDCIRLRSIRADLYGGDLTGSATIPLLSSAAGAVDIRFKGLELGPLTKNIPGMSLRLEGRADGKIAGTLSADAGKGRRFTGDTELQAAQMRVQGIPTERLHGKIRFHDGVTDYRFDGDSLGGKFELDGRVPPAGSGAPAASPTGGRQGRLPWREGILVAQAVPAPAAQGHLRVRGARLGRLWQVLALQESLGPLRGVLDFEVAYRFEGPNRTPVGDGQFVLRNLRWGTDILSDSIRGAARLTEDELRLANLTGSLGQGLLRGTVAYNFKVPEASWFNLALDNVELARALTPWPSLAARVQGPADIHLRGRMGREWRGGGEIDLVRGKILGIEASEFRLPIDFTFAPRYGYGELELRDLSGQLAHGRVVGRASLRLGLSRRVEGQLRFFGVDVRTLLQQAGEFSQSGSGLLNGRFDFASGDLRSLDDLTGTLTATLAQPGQAQSFPVLQQINPFLGFGLSSTTFRSGDLRARLGGGALRIERLSLVGQTVRLFIDGTVTLLGRLDLRVTANTGTIGIPINPNALRLAGLSLPATGPVPVALLIRASNYLSNRVIHLRVVGTIRSPTVQVQALPTLSEEAVRFFLGQTNLPVPLTGASP
jgi:hypothetical protein